MRHRKKGQKMGRTASHRRATLANMAAALIKHEQIETTLAKARALRPFMEKLITLSKKGALHQRRLAIARLREQEGARKLFSVLGPRYQDRQGGYTRIVKTGFRRGDDAPQAVIELVDRDEDAKGKDSGPPPPVQDAPSD